MNLLVFKCKLRLVHTDAPTRTHNRTLNMQSWGSLCTQQKEVYALCTNHFDVLTHYNSRPGHFAQKRVTMFPHMPEEPLEGINSGQNDLSSAIFKLLKAGLSESALCDSFLGSFILSIFPLLMISTSPLTYLVSTSSTTYLLFLAEQFLPEIK